MADDPTRLVVLFAPGLWPYRSELDTVCWMLTSGTARAINAIPGLTAYATPRARIDSGDLPRLYRSLPPDDVVLDEARTLGATWVTTGRLLADAQGIELWLNLVDGESGHLLQTHRRRSSLGRLVWTFVGGFRSLLQPLGLDLEPVHAPNIAPSTSVGALSAFTRAQRCHVTWTGDVEGGLDIVRHASRAAALDHDFDEAIDLLLSVGIPLVERIDHVLQLEQLRESILGSVDFPPARQLRQAAHQRVLALAKAVRQT